MTRKIFAIFLVLVFLFSSSLFVHGYTLVGSCVLDPDNVIFKISTTASQYTSRITQYAETWETHCNEIGISQTGGTTYDIYVYSDTAIDNGSYAVTVLDRYGKSTITLYKDFTALSYAYQNETIVHEFGHALGLDHTQPENNTISVMREYGFNSKAYPLADDKDGIYIMYRNM